MAFSSRIPSSLTRPAVGIQEEFCHNSEDSLAHCLHSHTLFVREEDEDLDTGVIPVVREEVQLTPTRRLLVAHRDTQHASYADIALTLHSQTDSHSGRGT